MVIYGVNLTFGLGCKIDYEEAINYYQMAAKRKNATAVFNFGTMYYGGRGTKVDKQKESEYFQLSADLGNKDAMYEYARDYSHILIQSQSYEYEKVVNRIKKEFEKFKNTGIDEVDFTRAKRKNYGIYVREFEDVENIGNNFVDSFFKGINPFDFIEESKNIDKEYVDKVLKEVFKEEKMILSVIANK